MRKSAWAGLIAVGSVLVAAGFRSGVHPAPASQREEFALTHLDGRALPVDYEDPQGKFTLHQGELVLGDSGQLWFVLHLSPRGASKQETQEHVTTDSYRWVVPDSLEFPYEADAPEMPAEFFGRRVKGDLTVRALTPPSNADFSLSREFGGPHVWRFTQKR